jgi:hypothetical protein
VKLVPDDALVCPPRLEIRVRRLAGDMGLPVEEVWREVVGDGFRCADRAGAARIKDKLRVLAARRVFWRDEVA